MVSDSAFWHDLEAQFRALPDPKVGLTAYLDEGKWLWGVTGGPGDTLQIQRLEDLFCSLATKAAIAAGVPSRGKAIDGWLNLLRAESPHFNPVYGTHDENGIQVPDEGGWIKNLALASAEYCIVRECGAFKSEASAAHGENQRAASDRDERNNVASTSDKRLSGVIESLAAARRMEAFMKSKGIGQTEFAGMVGITDRTLRAFRKTGKLRRSLFDAVAREMGTTREDLLRPE